MASRAQLACAALAGACVAGAVVASRRYAGAARVTARKIKLHYLPVRARAEPIRLMFAFAGVEYEYVCHAFTPDGWAKQKAAHTFPFDELPVLELDGELVAQSGSCTRLAATISGLMPADPLEAAQVDTYFELAQEFGVLNPVLNQFVKDPEERKKRVAHQSSKLKWVAEKLGSSDFLFGSSPSYADFGLFHYIDVLKTLKPDVFESCAVPTVAAWYARIAALPGVSTYLSKRPPPRSA